MIKENIFNILKERGYVEQTIDEENYVLEKYGKRPLAYMEDMNWNRPNSR